MKTAQHLALLSVCIVAIPLQVLPQVDKSPQQSNNASASPDFGVVYETRTVTNYSISFDANGVKTITIRTNNVRLPVSGGTDFKVLKAQKLEKIREEKALGKNKEIREKWEILNAKAAHLRHGMNLNEIVQILGVPSKARRKVREPGRTYHKEVLLEELIQDGAFAQLIFSPHQNYDTVRPPHSPYETLYLHFNEEGRLKDFDWYP